MAQAKVPAETTMKSYRIVVKGVVQGVGFRPFVYHLACKWGIKGSVVNADVGVIIRAEGPLNALIGFTGALKEELPPLAAISDFDCRESPPSGYTDFAILDSVSGRETEVPEVLIPPDVATCADCARDVCKQTDRHYRYPFTNCTNCGPRFTIIKVTPYDRLRTAMSVFPMCDRCAGEYHSPADRRFHAQPVACPDCGPQMELLDEYGHKVADGNNWLEASWDLLLAGKILAVKGLGGFHLACDARNPIAVQILRHRKGREFKPFAVMCRELEIAQKYCIMGEEEAALLTSPAAPIVILTKRIDLSEPHPLPEELAPGLKTLGVMLPYTPLHMLLCGGPTDMLVMTSGNYSNLPLIKDNRRALTELGGIAEYFLQHNREIVNRCDDSLLRVIDSEVHFYRRSRGYVPGSVAVARPAESPVVLGIGGEMKNSFCLLKGNQAFMSAYIGELDSVEGEENLRGGIAQMQRLVGAVPEIVAYDSHPAYASATVAREILSRHYFPVQHHHSHLASCMAENGLDNITVVGAILDGTGYGPDGRMWGFEILSGNYVDFKRHWHLAYVSLPGGDAAVRQPWRTAVSYLITTLGSAGREHASRLFPNKNIEIIEKMMQNNINVPESSGCGRLFDAVAAILGICLENTYEGQGAVELEAALPEGLSAGEDRWEWRPYPFELADGIIRPDKMLAAVVDDQRNHVPVSVISLRFHQTIVEMVGSAVDLTASVTGSRRVVLSGGTWQNPYLFSCSKKYLMARGYEVFYHRQVPANDGGIALGQAMVAYWRWRKNVFRHTGQSSRDK